jgi:hypothetical protein
MIRWVWAFIDRPLAGFEQALAFWSAATASELSPRRGVHDEFVTLLPPRGDPCVKLQGVNDSGGAHLDLEVDDVPATVSAARDLGASVVAPHADWVVLRSPSGQPFCVAPWDGASTRPPVVTQPDGTLSRLDQVCIDVAPAAFENEVEFWTTLTGWAFHPGALPEFSLVAPDAMLPVRILLQRLDSSRDTGAHLDLACADVEATRAWHEELDARMVRRSPFWIVMEDPASGSYCLTMREPLTGRLPDRARSRVG